MTNLKEKLAKYDRPNWNYRTGLEDDKFPFFMRMRNSWVMVKNYTHLHRLVKGQMKKK